MDNINRFFEGDELILTREIPKGVEDTSDLDVELLIQIDEIHAITKKFDVVEGGLRTVIKEAETIGLDGVYSYEIRLNNKKPKVLEQGDIRIKNSKIVDNNFIAVEGEPLKSFEVLEKLKKLDKAVLKEDGQGLVNLAEYEGLKVQVSSNTNYDDTALKEQITALENDKVSKVEGKDLIKTEEFEQLKQQVGNHSNYDDTELTSKVNANTALATSNNNEITQVKQSVATLGTSKVDKDGDKVLSEVNFTKVYEDKLKVLNNYDDTEVKANLETVNTTLSTKVDKVDGKGLSTEDYTTEEKANLTALADKLPLLTPDKDNDNTFTNVGLVKEFISGMNTSTSDVNSTNFNNYYLEAKHNVIDYPYLPYSYLVEGGNYIIKEFVIRANALGTEGNPNNTGQKTALVTFYIPAEKWAYIEFTLTSGYAYYDYSGRIDGKLSNLRTNTSNKRTVLDIIYASGALANFMSILPLEYDEDKKAYKLVCQMKEGKNCYLILNAKVQANTYSQYTNYFKDFDIKASVEFIDYVATPTYRITPIYKESNISETYLYQVVLSTAKEPVALGSDVYEIPFTSNAYSKEAFKAFNVLSNTSIQAKSAGWYQPTAVLTGLYSSSKYTRGYKIRVTKQDGAVQDYLIARHGEGGYADIANAVTYRPIFLEPLDTVKLIFANESGGGLPSGYIDNIPELTLTKL